MGRVVHEQLMRWGSSIKNRFDRDNIHLTCNYEVKGEKRFVDNVVKVVRGLQQDMKQIKKQQEIQLIKTHELQMSIAQLHEIVMTMGQQTNNVKRSHVEVESGHLSSGCVTPTKKMKMQLFFKSKQEKPQIVKVSNFNSCGSLFLSVIEKKTRLNMFKKQDRRRAKRVVDHFNAFCTTDEQQLLCDPKGDRVKKIQVVRKLTELVKSIYREAFKDLEKLPSVLEPDSKRPFKASTLEGLENQLRNKTKPIIVPSTKKFEKFRESHKDIE